MRRSGSCSPRGGVNIDSVGANVWMRHRRMTVHDESLVFPRAVEELITNPDQIVNILLLNRNARTNARMHEQEIAATELVAQALHHQFVRTWKHVEKAATHLVCRSGSVVQFYAV